jgi:hypothetical protein
MAIKNYQIFKENLNQIIQNSNLDIGAVYFIMKDTLKDIEMLYYSQINSEMMEEQKNQEQKEQSNEEAL